MAAAVSAGWRIEVSTVVDAACPRPASKTDRKVRCTGCRRAGRRSEFCILALQHQARRLHKNRAFDALDNSARQPQIRHPHPGLVAMACWARPRQMVDGPAQKKRSVTRPA